jgi:rhodanese-related sulfurtransferase
MRARRTAGLLVAILAGYALWLSLEARSAAGDDAVGSVDVHEICVRVRDGRPPVFVDVREPEEFAEEHLPMAISMPVREMIARAQSELPGADLLVPYCLKDFRGFEGARRLLQLGFADVRVMKQVGINGWKAAGLPTAGAIPGRSDGETSHELLEICQRQAS